MALEWKTNGDILEAHYDGRIRYTIETFTHGPALLRWSANRDGTLRCIGKEAVSSIAYGKDYAEGLHELAYPKPKPGL